MNHRHAHLPVSARSLGTARSPRHAAVRPARLAAAMAAIATICALAALTACSTTEGFGKDVKNLGGDIEGSAARNT